jgi:acetyltransferase-like isoleucine patch superfamily enzyme
VRRLRQEIVTALQGFRFKLRLANLICGVLPQFSMTTLRASLYRAVGIRAGARVSFMHTIAITGSGDHIYGRLSIGEDTTIGTAVMFNLDERVTIGRNVMVGPYTRIYTGRHRMGPSTRRFDPDFERCPVVIEDGAWIGLNSIILAGTTIGHGAVVGAGSVVNRDVAPNTLVSGVPAAFVKDLGED